MNNAISGKPYLKNIEICSRTSSIYLPSANKHLSPDGSMVGHSPSRCYLHWPLYRLSDMEEPSSRPMVGKEDFL